MGKNNNFESKQTPENQKKSGFITTLVVAWAMLLPVLKWQANTLVTRDKTNTSTEIFENLNTTNDANTYDITTENINKDSTAIDYLKNNLYIKWVSIQDPKLNAEITKIWENKYSIKYDHEFEWIQNFSEPANKKVNIEVTFTYKNNNIYLSFEDVTIWKYKLDNIWTLSLKNTIYDYNIVAWEKEIKVWYLNSKANPYKTFEKIENNIQEKEFAIPNTFKEIKEFENTQLTPLNDIKIGKEVFQEWDFFYREVFLTWNWQYKPMAKIFFDKYGKVDRNKTKEELSKSNTKILWVDVKFILTDKDTLKMDRTSAINLVKKIQSDRQALISLIDQAKIWPNNDFTWFNKELWVRAWSNWKELWLFNTTFIGVDLVNSEYTFARWKDKKQTIWFIVDSNEWWTASISMVNWNHQKVNNIYVTTNDWFFRINISWNQLTIDKIKKEWQNITEHLPEYQWNQTITNIIMKKTNHYYDWSALEYVDNEWDVITSIKCKKEEKWTFSIEKQSTDINIVDLYNSKQFRDLTKEIKRIWDKVGVLDVDIMNDFSTLLAKNWVKLNNQDVIRVDNKWEIYYCTIDKKYNVQIDEKLYLWAEKALNTIKEKLYTIEKINKRKILWKNKWQTQDFEKFVWWSRWIWKRLISENDINNFISWNTNEVSANILWWKWEETIIIYSISNKWKITPKITWKKEVTISWMTYKINVDKKTWDIILDPIEKK
jgi:hypothetical protein